MSSWSKRSTLWRREVIFRKVSKQPEASWGARSPDSAPLTSPTHSSPTGLFPVPLWCHVLARLLDFMTAVPSAWNALPCSSHSRSFHPRVSPLLGTPQRGFLSHLSLSWHLSQSVLFLSIFKKLTIAHPPHWNVSLMRAGSHPSYFILCP